MISHMVSHVSPGTTVPTRDLLSLSLFHGFGDQLGSWPSLSFPAASCFTPSDVGSGSFRYVCLVLIS